MKIPLRRYWQLLYKYLRPQRVKVGLLALLMFGALGLQLLTPQIVRRFLDGAEGGAPLGQLINWALLFLLAVVLREVVNGAGRYVGEDVGWTATNALRTDLVKHCLRLDMSFHKSHAPGELIERLDGDVNLLSNFFSQFAIGIVSNLLLLLGVLVMLYREDWRLGLVLTVFTAVALLVLNYTRGLAVGKLAESRGMAGRFYGFLGEHLAGTEDIRANGAVGYAMHRLYGELRDWLRIHTVAYRLHALMRASGSFVFLVGNGLAFGLGAWLFLRSSISLGTVYLITRYTDLLKEPIAELRNQLQDLQRATASISRIERLFAEHSAVQSGPGVELPAGALSLQFRNVQFAYEDDQPVLRGVDLDLPAGQVLGLLGRTGSGKTTIGRLIARFYDPSQGEILLGGQRAADAKLPDLRRRVGVVTQDVQLFHGTVRDNLTFFRREVADEQIAAVLLELGLGSWLESLADGLNSVLPAGGAGLSAGEAQMLALARCFLANPSIIVLDEPSSRLDPVTEQRIERALDRLLRGRTAIIIAHRLETIQRADRIVILEQGQVVEQGERLQLASDTGSRLYQLLQAGIKEVLA